MMQFTLAFKQAISVNVRLGPGRNRRGDTVASRLVLTEAYRQRLSNAKIWFLSQRPRHVRPDATTKWVLLFDIWFPNDKLRVARDADNYVKMPKDALEGVIYETDAQVVYHDALGHGKEGKGKVVLTAIPWDEFTGRRDPVMMDQ